MAQVQLSLVCDAPVAVTFAYLDDYRTTPEWMYGLERFEPVGEQTNGLGAVFDATARIGATLQTTIEVVEWEQDHRLGLTSVEGFDVSMDGYVLEVDAERSRVEATVEYHFPGGLAGRALEKAVEPFVSIALRHVEHTIRRNVEQLHDG